MSSFLGLLKLAARDARPVQIHPDDLRGLEKCLAILDDYREGREVLKAFAAGVLDSDDIVLGVASLAPNLNPREVRLECNFQEGHGGEWVGY